MGAMWILGLTHPMAWNNAACLLRDGEIVLFVEEERLNRFKQAYGLAPVQALQRCLDEAGIGLSEVDRIGVGWDVAAWKKRRDKVVWDYQFKQLPLDPDDPRIRYVRHHLTHVLSAFDPSPFETAACLSFDGTGESEAGLLCRCAEGPPDILASIPRRESWGYLYGKVTETIGFEGHRDEGKVMGLAAWGTPDPDRFDFIDWSRPIPRIDKKGFKKFLAGVERRRPDEEIRAEHMDLAATLQAAFERGLVAMARWLRDRTGEENLVLAGGCALNCAGNGALVREGIFERIFVQPAAHDAGTALGAALALHRETTGNRAPLRLVSAGLGPRFACEEVGALLRATGSGRVRETDNPAGEAAALLAEGKVVGWFQGAMEVGPRALGFRSILADPRDASMRDRVNRIKGREPWRPLAPSLLEEEAGRFLAPGNTPSPFMLIAFAATEEARKRIPAVVHVDGTVRAQILDGEGDGRFRDLVARFRDRTGIGAVLNTSFNARGEPIVCTPRDALQAFYSMGLDALVIENFVVLK